ncbi:MAG: signal recognition particle-docking protein FtsY [Rhodospirillales bacterium]
MNETDPQDGDRPGWLFRLKRGLGRSSSKLAEGVGGLLTKKRLDAGAIEELEELLITADLGVDTAARLARSVAARRFEGDAGAEVVLGAMAGEVEAILAPVARPLQVDPANKPHVIVVCGVNGCGTTTTIGTLAGQFTGAGRTVMLAAADTFRAAAVEQLRAWGDRTGCPVVAAKTGADPAGLVFEALEKARAAGADVLMVDTAGRLHNKADLMAELQKIVRVISKLDHSAPHDCILVLDATVGQNAHNQVEAFADMVEVSGLIVTKLDGTAKGGVVVALAERFGLAIHAVGVGESAQDLHAFEARAFARSLMGLEG